MATIQITSENFDQTIKDNAIVLLDFWAGWCGPCRSFAPIYEAAAESNPDIAFGKIDTEAQREIAGMFAISSIPTVVAFREGIVVFAQPGALAPPQLDDLISQIRDLDMDEVRAQLDAQTSAAAEAGTQGLE